MNKYADRTLEVIQSIQKSSFFLMGPRGTGKSFLLKHQFKNASNVLIVSLLDSSLYLRLQANPSLLKDIIIGSNKKIIIIDEVQRLPELLNIVHLLIEEYQIKFILTGSSARKLKRSHANLLAGRALQKQLFPLTWHELSKSKQSFELEKYLQIGGLPMSYFSDDSEDYLDAYVNTYLKEEVQAESLVKNLPAFSQFLQMAAASCGDIINFTSISNEVGVASKTIKEYYSILEDTLLGFFVRPWLKSITRKPIQTAKFYFFDTGVKNTLTETRDFNVKSVEGGKAFEHFIAMELRAFISYKMKNRIPLLYWRTTSQFEVDFLLGDEVAIEVKSTNKVALEHLKGLKALQEEQKFKKYFLISNDRLVRNVDGIQCLPWSEFLKDLWNGSIIKF